MKIIMIAAMAQNRTIGKENTIPWHLREDFEFFKQNTTGFPIIMGKNTFKSLKKTLPNRENIVLTRNPVEGLKCFSSMQDSINYCKEKGYEKTFLIGGASVYEEGLKIADTILLTQIEQNYEGDTKFPEINDSHWKLTEVIRNYSEENDFHYSFNTFERI